MTKDVAQGEGNRWYFGYNAGLDFTSGSSLPCSWNGEYLIKVLKNL